MKIPPNFSGTARARLKTHSTKAYVLSLTLHTSSLSFRDDKKDHRLHTFSIPSIIKAIPSITLPFPNRTASLRSVPIVEGQRQSLDQINEILGSLTEEQGLDRANQVWNLYSNLSATYRRTIPLLTLQQICLAIIPSKAEIQNIIGNPRTRDPASLKSHRKKVMSLAKNWEIRLRAVALDLLVHPSLNASMKDLAPSEMSIPETIILSMSKLAMLGEKSGCEAISFELKKRFPNQIKSQQWAWMYNFSLRSVVRWLYLNAHRQSTAQGEVKEAVEALRRLITSMQEQGIAASEQTGLALLDTNRYISFSSKDPAIVNGFKELAYIILEGGYGIKQTAFGWVGLKVDLPTQVKLAVITLIGEEKRLWEMVAAYEAMYSDNETSVEFEQMSEALKGDGEDVPALNMMTAKEQDEQSKRDWLGRVRDTTHVVAEPDNTIDPIMDRKFSNFLLPIPSPSSIISHFDDDPYLHIARCLSKASPAKMFIDNRDTPYSYIFKTMLYYVWSDKDEPGSKQVGLHIFRIALRAAHLEQTDFFRQLLQEEQPNTTSPTLIVDPKWFEAAWKILRHNSGRNRSGSYFKGTIMEEIEEAQQRLEEEARILRTVLEKSDEVEKDKRSLSTARNTQSRLISIRKSLSQLVGVKQTIEHSTARLTVARRRRRISKSLHATTQQLQEGTVEIDNQDEGNATLENVSLFNFTQAILLDGHFPFFVASQTTPPVLINMANPASLSQLADPISLGRIQILITPVHLPDNSLPSHIYESYVSLIGKHQTLRGDELSRPLNPSISRVHSSALGGSSSTGDGDTALRFFPKPSGIGMSASKAASSHHVHLGFTQSPPARHTYPLSLLRMADFPLIVLGVAIEDDGEKNGNGLGVDDKTSIEDAITPTAPTFQENMTSDRPLISPQQVFQDTLTEIFPPDSSFPIVKRLLMVPRQLPGTPTLSKGSTSAAKYEFDGLNGIGRSEIRCAPIDGVENWVTRVLGEVVGDLLGEIGTIATALETQVGLQTLSSTLLPSLKSTSPGAGFQNFTSQRSATPGEYPSRANTLTPTVLTHPTSIDSNGSRNVSLARSLTPGGRPTSVQASSQPPMRKTTLSPAAPQPIQPVSSNPFRRSTAISLPFSRTSSAASTNSQPSQTSSSSFSSSITRYTSADLSGIAGGRLLKLLGDFYLLAGMYSDAIKCFDESAERCKAMGDALWEGVVREGRAVAGVGEAWEGRDGSNVSQSFTTSPIPAEILSYYLSALACISRAPVPYPPSILSPSPQAVSGSLTFLPPVSTDLASIGTGEGLLALLYSTLSLRISHFMLLIWASSGWGSIALSSIMAHTLPRSFPLPLTSDFEITPAAHRRRFRNLANLSAHSQITRNSIFAHVQQAIGPHHRAMTKLEQLDLYKQTVWLARWLGLERKEATVTREVIKRLTEVVVERRQEIHSHPQFPSPRSTLVPSRVAGDPPIGLGLDIPLKSQTVAVRRKEVTEGNSGIVALFRRAASIMGIRLLPSTPNIARHSLINVTDISDNSLQDLGFGWPELQVEMMKEGIAVMESLPDHAAIIKLCLSALHGLHYYLNHQTQGILAKMYLSALATIRRRGLDCDQIPWWVPGNIVMSLEVASLSPNKIPNQHSKEEFMVENGQNDLFLYNPRTKILDGGKIMLVSNEPIDIFVTLRNPFAFNLDIQELNVLTIGVPLITSCMPLAVPALAVHTIRLSTIASTPGTLQIRGVSIRLADGSSTDVLLPVINTEERQRRQKRYSKFKRESIKSKGSGMDARIHAINHVAAKQSLHELDGKEQWLECMIVEPLPLAWIKATSLTHGVIMLYNGESSIIHLTLENSSSVPINFIKLSFDDSTAHEAHAIVSEGELTLEQAYELDWDQQKRPVFTWENLDNLNDGLLVPSGGRVTLAIRCFGKIGCTDGVIQIDYGSIDMPSRETSNYDNMSNIFHTRRITFPVVFTVYHTIECHSLDLTYLPAHDRHTHHGSDYNHEKQTIDNAIYSVLEEDKDKNGCCLLGLNMRNTYGVPFEVTLTRVSEGKSTASVECTRLIPPGATERMLLPMSRQFLPSDVISQAIPSLSERQYIVNKDQKSAERALVERELFWSREFLLRTVRATWKEPGTLRYGSLNLRGQPLSPDLLPILKPDTVNVNIHLKTRDRGSLQVHAMNFVDLVIEIVNNTGCTFYPHIHLEPLPSSSTDHSWASLKPIVHPISSKRHSSPHKNILFDGLVSSSLPSLKQGEKTTYKVGMMFLAVGEYGFRAAVEEFNPGNKGYSTPENAKKVWFSPLLSVDVL
ncbi:uncharacterized protein L203_103838 [Cryptococcus depauperatus CBS 7841]|uniref:Uncharacterized protein n=1 Tax=Cryptococcus depauperatus CBS 7841 TaxID=1295531 RepID=A0AAJ8JUD6_9TREE